MTKFSSFKKQQKLFENWRRFTESEIDWDKHEREGQKYKTTLVFTSTLYDISTKLQDVFTGEIVEGPTLAKIFEELEIDVPQGLHPMEVIEMKNLDRGKLGQRYADKMKYNFKWAEAIEEDDADREEPMGPDPDDDVSLTPAEKAAAQEVIDLQVAKGLEKLRPR